MKLVIKNKIRNKIRKSIQIKFSFTLIAANVEMIKLLTDTKVFTLIDTPLCIKRSDS